MEPSIMTIPSIFIKPIHPISETLETRLVNLRIHCPNIFINKVDIFGLYWRAGLKRSIQLMLTYA
eukprot:scaffold17413_cov55-Cyclotella_meneghiniana.AAC.7